MKNILVTGSQGFIGKNLCSRLSLMDGINVLEFNRETPQAELNKLIDKADFIFHIAGVNRPENEADFKISNTDLTTSITEYLISQNKNTPLLISSSTQAELDNSYGRSKLAAEECVKIYAKKSGGRAYIYRLPGVFGKWSKPNYNSVVSTFCYNIANDLEIQISDPKHEIRLTYIDDVMDSFIAHIDKVDNEDSVTFCEIKPTYTLTLKNLSDRIKAIHNIKSTLVVPDLSDSLNKKLYATYISYLNTENFAYKLEKNSDNRGWLAEFIKSHQFGQIFVSKTKPGIYRGNHWHNTKIEKFLVVEGQGEITFRNKVDSSDILRYPVDGENPTVLDIPTGYVHAIKNIGDTDLIAVFWANEILDKNKPDTFFEEVESAGDNK